MQTALLQLKQLVSGIHPLSDADWKEFSTHWKPFAAKRKELLTAMGEKERHLYFVIDGVQRVYYFDEQNREATLVFTYSPSFGGVLDSLLLQTPSKYFYETLTPSVFLRAPVSELKILMQSRPAIETLIRQGTTHALSGLLTRLVELQCYSAEERFMELLKRSPHILQLVPHKYLANYLGMDATNFSKFINRIKI
ncbi:Crp/Fnr family transcriptional regulator [Emticicia sp. 21SJ11W-3]|uniref:Crp/Fnr family transcriptional regulator n=1 Tax=Emticicia sp. 21SJ11W-3 TaxID=2916755 RepID=UPI00209CB228|nr:cyclic nucleotide-binding domain-containing protein [Emticicia sp. 21SJ11W-3]UTA69328.1 cyclic nucleotide-binding domain-containing protein [Emticicia sp. 21SJ11W-3]